MEAFQIKTDLHKLIDNIENTELLKSLMDFLQESKNSKPGHLWQTLSETEKQEVLEAYMESENEDSLISHLEVLKKLK